MIQAQGGGGGGVFGWIRTEELELVREDGWYVGSRNLLSLSVCSYLWKRKMKVVISN